MCMCLLPSFEDGKPDKEEQEQEATNNKNNNSMSIMRRYRFQFWPYTCHVSCNRS